MDVALGIIIVKTKDFFLILKKNIIYILEIYGRLSRTFEVKYVGKGKID